MEFAKKMLYFWSREYLTGNFGDDLEELLTKLEKTPKNILACVQRIKNNESLRNVIK